MGSADLSPMVDAYEHALFAQRPRSEYFPGRDSTLMSYLAILPAGLVDFFFTKVIVRASAEDNPVPKCLVEKARKKQSTKEDKAWYIDEHCISGTAFCRLYLEPQPLKTTEQT